LGHAAELEVRPSPACWFSITLRFPGGLRSTRSALRPQSCSTRWHHAIRAMSSLVETSMST